MKRLLILAPLAIAGSAQAILTLDDFSTGQMEVMLNSGSWQGTQTGSMVGGQREIYLEVLSNPQNNTLMADAGFGGFFFDGDTGMTGIGEVRYGVASPLDLDLAPQYDRFRLRFTHIFGPLDMDIEVVSPHGTATYQTTLPQAGNSNTDVLFAEMTGGIPFTDISSMRFRFVTTTSGHFGVNDIWAVPEPATFMALAAGTLTLLRRRRHRAPG